MRNANCTACPLHAHARNVCIDGRGPRDADILVVGQNPGQDEDRRGEPFIGASGKLLDRQLDKAELRDYKIRYTNIVRCVTPNNREPTAKEIKACKPYLDDEIARVAPRYVVPMGAPATKAVAKTKVSTSHGQMIEIDGRVVMPTYHPAASFRDPSKLTVIANDFARLRRHVDGTLGQTNDAFKYQVVHTPADLQSFWRDFEAAEDYAYDTETNGLIIFKRDFVVRALAVALPEKAWVIPMEMPKSLYQHDHARQSAFFRLLAKKAAGKWCAVHHGKYDSGVVRQCYGVELPYHFDGMMAHSIIDENQDHDLKYISRIELDCPEYDLPKKLKESDWDGWETLLLEGDNLARYWEYAARDAWNTLHWSYKAAKRLERSEAQTRLFRRLVMPSSRALEWVEREGLPILADRYQQEEARVALERTEALRVLNETAEINWGSHPQVRSVLFDDLKLPVKAYTDGGVASTSEEAIVDLKGVHPIIEQLLHYRELDKIQGTYLEGWKKKGYIINGRLYLSYKQNGTVTGRFSSRLHSIPTDGTIRSIIGGVETMERGEKVIWDFTQIDLSQAELRVAAEMSRDTTLMRIYREGKDVHWNTVLYMIGAGHMPEYTERAIETARALKYGFKMARVSITDALEILEEAGVEKCVQHWKEWKTARTNAKRVAFGFLYGMYENTFIKKAKVDYDWMCTWKQAHAFRTGFFEVYHGLPKWHDTCKRLARIDGYVTNFFGRMRRLPAIFSTDRSARSEAERQAVNAPVQGTIGDWKSAGMIEIHETVDRNQFRLCGEHHDALLGLVRRGCEDIVLPQVRQIMQRPKLLDTFKIKTQVPMVADVTIGPWGMGKSYADPR